MISPIIASLVASTASLTALNCIRQNQRRYEKQEQFEQDKLKDDIKPKEHYTITRKPYTSEKWRVN